MNRLNDANDVIEKFIDIGDVIIYLLIGLAVIYIVYATVQYMIKGREGDENRKAAGMQILWGIVGLAIIVSLWGLVNLLINTFNTSPDIPDDRLPNANFLDKIRD